MIILRVLKVRLEHAALLEFSFDFFMVNRVLFSFLSL